jgi:hypothetical protein
MGSMATWNGERWTGSSTGDFYVRDMVQRAVGERAVRPRDVRMMGVAHLLLALMLFLFTQGHLMAGYYYPKLVGVIPAVIPTGLWYLVDAGALARGERRHQRAITWGSTGLGFLLGLAVIIRLGG